MRLVDALRTGKKVPPDVTELLAEDHRTVLGWFRWYDEAADPAVRLRLVARICAALRAHMAGEEEFLYPAITSTQVGAPLAERAVAEHAHAKSIMDRLEQEPGDGAASDERVAQLRNEVAAHIAEEETQLFPLARRAPLDLYDLGRAVAARRVDVLLKLRAGNVLGRSSISARQK
jgi:iron-sulfur cluster repair protein YtfE (RIC family)